MLSFALTLLRLPRALRGAWRDALFRASFYLTLMILVSGTMFYALAQGLRWVDLDNLSFVTLTTLGSGDLAPATDFGKIFTVIYLFSGVGVLVVGVTRLARAMLAEPAVYDDTDGRAG